MRTNIHIKDPIPNRTAVGSGQLEPSRSERSWQCTNSAWFAREKKSLWMKVYVLLLTSRFNKAQFSHVADTSMPRPSTVRQAKASYIDKVNGIRRACVATGPWLQKIEMVGKQYTCMKKRPIVDIPIVEQTTGFVL